MNTEKYKYVMYCEDQPQRLFLKKILSVLPTFNNFNVSFEHLETEKLGFQKGKYNRKVILNTYKNQSEIILEKFYDINLFFVGLDYDDISNKNFDIFYTELTKENLKNKKIIFFIPLQCIEHWYYFIKTQENPSTKTDNVEKTPRDEVKKLVYGNIKDKQSHEVICKEILTQLDIDFLKQKSHSFNKFVTILTNYLKTLNP